jgi:dCMP deaminase
MRPSWTDTWLAMANAAADRSTCLKLHVGAVLVKDNRVIATGYNGAPSGQPHCEECIRIRKNIPAGEQYELCESIHAEMNCLLQAGERAKGSDIFMVVKDPKNGFLFKRFPCFMCSKFLLQNGVVSCYVLTQDFTKFAVKTVEKIYQVNRAEKGMT